MSLELHENYEQMYENIRAWMLKYLQASPNIKSMVLGVSGGIDSALVAAIARTVCDDLNLKLHGYSIPIESNKEDEKARAKAVGEAFCHEFHEKDLTSLYYTVTDEFPTFNWFKSDGYQSAKTFDPGTPIRRGNIKARLRMLFLYNEAHRKEGLVLSTDNLTEYYLGFWTLHGDVGDLGPIQSLWKTEVYGLADWLSVRYGIHSDSTSRDRSIALEACIHAVPTDGLGITNSDLDQLGDKTYRDVDDKLISYLSVKYHALLPEQRQELSESPVIKRHLASEYKRQNPYNIPREVALGEDKA